MYLRFLKTDETDHWNVPDEMKAKVKAIWGCYVYDPLWRVHLCEFTASYELHQLRSEVEFVAGVTDEDMEAIDDFVFGGECWDEPITYMHCHTVDKAGRFRFYPKQSLGVVRVHGFAVGFVPESNDLKAAREERHNAAIEEGIEWYHANGGV